jgi:hypothetical protein
MARSTINQSMVAGKRETAQLMHRSGIGNNPGFCIMAFGTIRPKRILVHIGVTGYTFAFCFLKFQRPVATFTIDKLMLT